MPRRNIRLTGLGTHERPINIYLYDKREMVLSKVTTTPRKAVDAANVLGYSLTGAEATNDGTTLTFSSN